MNYVRIFFNDIVNSGVEDFYSGWGEKVLMQFVKDFGSMSESKRACITPQK